MAGTFSTRIRQLEAEGDLSGSVVVDQVYAQNQHESLHFKHPRGGQAKYLETPLYQRQSQYMQNVADSALDDAGRDGMVKSVEDLSDQVEVYAPVDLVNLRRSGHPTVEEDGVVVYDRPPKQRRLTPTELAELRKYSNWYGGDVHV